MNLKQYTTEELVRELNRRNFSADELRLKSESVDGVKWSDLMLVYTIEDIWDEKCLKIAPFYNEEFCFHNIGVDVKKLLPNVFYETTECIFEYFGEGNAEDGVKFLENLGFKTRRDDEFFGY